MGDIFTTYSLLPEIYKYYSQIEIISFNSYISLAPSILLDKEFVSYSFLVLEIMKSVKNNLCE